MTNTIQNDKNITDKTTNSEDLNSGVKIGEEIAKSDAKEKKVDQTDNKNK